ncbi:MAG: GNAT family N-acetyltransferase [Burkholderiaceae bacterium]|nr:GNAT family N-acetyltransferase [Sulfuritalea sp.]MCF8176482.1 GNAT family N-acetyltransferase [Burkholderiaceae bacterium]MCF8183761.1 GNAT family N-acetyltransferase [Polynucleobacter sp.]
MKIILHACATDIAESDWAQLDHGDDPFASRAFLGIAEKVGAGNTAMGWQAQHLALYEDDLLLGLLPLYLRTHSFGDFSRDWNWASAWQRAGLDYYPKLVSGIPYTPSPGPRLLVRRGVAREAVAPALLDAALDVARQFGVSSWQCLFVEENDRALLAAAGLLMRRGVQFHWFNRDYGDFDGFLGSFTADKRKKLKRERRQVHESGLRLETRHGDEIDASLWRIIHRQYRDTFARYGNHPAFPLEFFTEAGALLAHRLVVFIAFDDQTPVASAICYRDAETLYGRHWGTEIALPGLHFELCYYQGIEYCIRQGLRSFEPGAQGEHKLARGFEPVPTWSAFWIAHPGMCRAVADFILREDSAMQDYQAETAAHLPFKLSV